MPSSSSVSEQSSVSAGTTKTSKSSASLRHDTLFQPLPGTGAYRPHLHLRNTDGASLRGEFLVGEEFQTAARSLLRRLAAFPHRLWRPHSLYADGRLAGRVVVHRAWLHLR